MTRKRKATAKVKTASKAKSLLTVAEAAPTYTARSRSVTKKPTKRAPQTKLGSSKRKANAGEALWDHFLTLSDDDQGVFLEKMLKKRQWREDIMDICVMMSRKGEPKRPFEEFIAELERERAK